MNRYFLSLYILAGVAAIVTCAIVARPAINANQHGIEIVPQGFSQIVDVTGDLPVELPFEVINNGATSLGPFDIHRECQCKLKKDLPQSIPPGGKSQFSIRITPPSWGILDTPIEISFGHSRHERVSFPLKIRNQSSFARLIHPPQKLTFSYIRGDRADSKIVGIRQRVRA